jgi:hypothetical protein
VDLHLHHVPSLISSNPKERRKPALAAISAGVEMESEAAIQHECEGRRLM